jgi:hypothetical protein
MEAELANKLPMNKFEMNERNTEEERYLEKLNSQYLVPWTNIPSGMVKACC